MVSGFLQFPQEESRRQFLAELNRDCPDLAGRLHVSQLRPRIVVESVSEPELERIRAALRDRGRWIPDAHFEPMTGGVST